jgi:hypothetical protein
MTARHSREILVALALATASVSARQSAPGNPSAAGLFLDYTQGRFDDVAKAVEHARIETAAAFTVEVAYAVWSRLWPPGSSRMESL